jgi:hypothetical protein
MRKTVLTLEARSTLKRLQAKDPGLKQLLNKAYGYAVFPSVGKAAAVVGGAYGRGVVFERGERVGYATIAQMTVGVQIGGDTFSEILIFESKQAMNRFKQGKMAWAANASAVLLKAGAGGTTDPQKGITALAYSQGGMMLELALGGQKFKFKPADEADAAEEEGGGGRQSASNSGDEGSQSDEDGGATGVVGRAVDGARDAASKAGSVARQHPVLTSLAGASLAAGLALLVARAVRQSSSGEDEDSDGPEDRYDEDEGGRGEEEYDDEQDEEDESGRRSAESDDSEEDESEEDDQDQEEEQPAARRSGSRRARARA